jgi:MoxR-like ATPase
VTQSIAAAAVTDLAHRAMDEVERAVVGKRAVLELLLVAILADGHALIEDVPGVAKTLIARSFAKVLGLRFARVQFTPDLMPMDVTGSVFPGIADGDMTFRPGPIFANLVLADEVNRAPAKTQAALLEAMEERQVTADGKAHQLERPFLVIATQNPIEFEGTYPLPEAELDRFILRLRVGYPTPGEEWQILARRQQRRRDEVNLTPVMNRDAVIDAQRALEKVHVADDVGRYMVALVTETRNRSRARIGASPRGSLALLKLSRGLALLRGRDFVTPDDVKEVAVPALGHRLVLRPELWVQDLTGDDVVREVLEEVPVPPTLPTGE